MAVAVAVVARYETSSGEARRCARCGKEVASGSQFVRLERVGGVAVALHPECYVRTAPQEARAEFISVSELSSEDLRLVQRIVDRLHSRTDAL